MRAAAQDIRFLEDMVVSQGAREEIPPTLGGVTFEGVGEDHGSPPTASDSPPRAPSQPAQDAVEGGNVGENSTGEDQQEEVPHGGDIRSF